MLELVQLTEEDIERQRDAAFMREYQALCDRHEREVAPDWDEVAAAADDARDGIDMERSSHDGCVRRLDGGDVEAPLRVVRW